MKCCKHEPDNNKAARNSQDKILMNFLSCQSKTRQEIFFVHLQFISIFQSALQCRFQFYQPFFHLEGPLIHSACAATPLFLLFRKMHFYQFHDYNLLTKITDTGTSTWEIFFNTKLTFTTIGNVTLGEFIQHLQLLAVTSLTFG